MNATERLVMRAAQRAGQIIPTTKATVEATRKLVSKNLLFEDKGGYFKPTESGKHIDAAEPKLDLDGV